MALPIIGSAVGLVGDIAGTWMKGRVQKQKAETEAKVAQIKAKAVVYEKQATGELDMEKTLTEQMGGSWKDEAWTILFIIIIAMCFIPFTQPYVEQGFAAHALEFWGTIRPSSPPWNYEYLHRRSARDLQG